MKTIIPQDIIDELNADAKAAGFPSRRGDTKNSRWNYLRKLLLLGRQFSHLISRD